MFKNLFKPKAADFVSPMSGIIIKMSDVPDPVFSSLTMGDGFAVNLQEGVVVSPVAGEVVAIFPTKHAIGIKAEDRNEYLVHIGLDTVNLKGEGFTSFVEMGQKVRPNDKLMEVDLAFMKQHNINMISPIVVTNLNGRKVKLLKEGQIQRGEKEILAIMV